jgi:hypothetical protein
VRTRREHERELREAKLAHVREQVSAGSLVIRQMTRAERARWAKSSAKFDACLTPAERAKRDSVLRDRRRRTEYARLSA